MCYEISTDNKLHGIYAESIRQAQDKFISVFVCHSDNIEMSKSSVGSMSPDWSHMCNFINLFLSQDAPVRILEQMDWLRIVLFGITKGSTALRDNGASEK